jgi:acetyltransferase-like isoleucine patch superfamily enzyme
MRIISMLKYPRLSGLALPFKIYCKTAITIRKSARVQLGGRLHFGNPDPLSAVISVLPANLYVGQKAVLKAGHSVSIGPGVNLIVKDGAELTIGEGTYFTSDSHIEASTNISIGSNCAISWGTTLIDDDHHQFGTSPIKPGSLVIEDDVWVGCNVTILKNSRIGKGSVVAANSLVRGEFPAHSLIGGNPAKVIKENISWKR